MKTTKKADPCQSQTERDYNMKQRKWEPVIINIMADGSRVDDLTKYTIPAGHSYYDIVASIYQKGA